MIAAEKIPLLLLLAVAAVAAQDRSLRHSRHYSHFFKIHEKIDKLDGLVLKFEDGEIEPVDKALLPSTTTKDDLKGEDYDDYSDEDGYDFEDEQTKVPEVIDPNRSHRLESDNDTVTSQEDSEFESVMYYAFFVHKKKI